MNNCPENCKVCKDFNDNYFKEQVKGLVDFIRWNELIFLVLSFIICYYIFGWFGIIIAVILDKLNHLQGGPMLGTSPRQEYPKQECSAGIKDCKICNNEYEHEFNVEYEKKLKWHEKIF